MCFSAHCQVSFRVFASRFPTTFLQSRYNSADSLAAAKVTDPCRHAICTTHVKHALLKDGWTITHDPLRLVWGRRDLFVDLGAERLIAAQKAQQRIAVEVKSFLGDSDMQGLEQALGQFVLYRTILNQREPERLLYLAVPERILQTIFDEPVGQLLLQQQLVRLMGFDPTEEEIVRWLPTTPIDS